MSSNKPIRRRAAMSTGGKAPRGIIRADVSDNDNDSDPAPTPPVRGTHGRGRGRGRGRGATTGSTRSTRAAKNAATKVKEETESEDGEDLALVETLSKHRQSKTIKALAQDEEETESTPTPRKRTRAANVEKKDTVHGDDDLEAPVKRKGPGRPRKVVKSLEVVPSDDDEEPVAPKAKPGVKTSKKSVIKMEESADEDESAAETVQKTPKKKVTKAVAEKRTVQTSTKSAVQAPKSIDSEADAHRPDSRPTYMRTPKGVRILEDDQELESPESPSPRKQPTGRTPMKSTANKRRTISETGSENSDSEREQASPTKKQRQRSPEVELVLTPAGKKNGKTDLRAVGFGKAEVIITSKPKGKAVSQPKAVATGGKKPARTKTSAVKAPDSASDFFNKSPVKMSKKGLFSKREESLMDAEAEESDGTQESDDDSTTHIEDDPEDWIVKSRGPPLAETPDEDLPEYVLRKKDVLHKPRSPTPGMDLDQDEADPSAQLDVMSLVTPQKGKSRVSSNEDKDIEDKRGGIFYSKDGIIDLSKHPEMAKILPLLQPFSPVEYDFSGYTFFTVDVHKTILDVPNYKMHPTGLLLTLGLSHDKARQFALNPSRADPELATTIQGASPSERVLAIQTRTGPHRAILFSLGIVLQSNVRFPTQAYASSDRLVKQIMFAPFQQEWLRMGDFIGTVFGVNKLKAHIFGPKIGDARMNGLVVRTMPMDDPNMAAAPPSFMLNGASSSQGRVNNDRPTQGAHPGQSFHVMASTTSWPTDTTIPIWDARKQFRRSKFVLDGVFTIEKTYELPLLNGELRYGDIVIVYYSASTYKLNNKARGASTSVSEDAGRGLGLQLYGAVLLGRADDPEYA